MMRSFSIVVTLVAVLALSAACGGGAPDAAGLRDSFAQQLGANTFITDFHRSGDEMTFSGPRAEGGPAAKWRVHIDSATVEPQNDERQPYKGTVKSSWFADERPVVASRSESNLPIELLSNGLSQDAWAFWDPTANRWSWE